LSGAVLLALKVAAAGFKPATSTVVSATGPHLACSALDRY